MHVIRARNVNDAYAQGLEYITQFGVRESTRNGDALVSPVPVTTVYERPTERVLFCKHRDANPFFHLVESIWMLAGRNDAALLTRYAKQIGEYAEADGTIHGAYGHRWRSHFHFDQIERVVYKLRADKRDRQTVITMWDPSIEVDFSLGAHNDVIETPVGGDDLTGNWKDRPCNTHLYLRVRESYSLLNGENYGEKILDMTVCCRSNDMIWGAYGANAVHFSVLQEYLAAAIGVAVGRMYQVSNNFHVYDNELLKRCLGASPVLRNEYELGMVYPQPMVYNHEAFLTDCEIFCDAVEYEDPPSFLNLWFAKTAWPMIAAHRMWKSGDKAGARKTISSVDADDWRLAGAEWFQRREK